MAKSSKSRRVRSRRAPQPAKTKRSVARQKLPKDAFRLKRILVPVDFSVNSKRALKYAVEFAKIFDGSLTLMYVVEPLVYPPDFSFGQIGYPNIEDEVTRRAEQELQALADEHIGREVATEKVVVSGKPFFEIIDYARENEIDLIIIATHGASGVEALLFGSTAEKVVRKAECPVLVVRGEPIKIAAM